MGLFVQLNPIGRKRPIGYVMQENGCWDWVGAVTRGGYGTVWVAGKQKVCRAARFYYEKEVGPIPDGLTIDHLCRNHLCVNPAHLEAVTNRENGLRGYGVGALNARKTHCKYGHPLSGDNLYKLWRRDVRAYERVCRECRRRRDRHSNTGRRHWSDIRKPELP